MASVDEGACLAVWYEPLSVSPLAVARSASGRCRLLWVFDADTSGPPEARKLLRRFGTVVDVSSADIDGAAAAMATHGPDGLLALADTQLVATAQLAERLGLPYVNPEIAGRLTDKYAQRRALAAAGVDVPGFDVVPITSDVRRLAAFASTVGYPAVVKPRWGGGSRDTVLVRDAEQLVRAVTDRGGPADELVVEAYLADGVPRAEQLFADYVSVETALAAGEIRHLGVTGCFPLAEPFRETGSFMPSALTAAETRSVLDTTSAALRAVGVTSGITHTEVKLTPAGPRIIEVNGRIGGDIPDLLRLSTQQDMFGIAMDIALDDVLPTATAHDRTADTVGYMIVCQAPTDRRCLTSVDGLQQVAKLPGVEAAVLNRQPGARLDWREGTYGYIYSVLGSTPDHAALARLHDEIFELVTVTYA